MDGRNVKSTLQYDNNVATVTEKWDGKMSTITYSVRDGQMIITCDMNGVVASCTDGFIHPCMGAETYRVSEKCK